MSVAQQTGCMQAATLRCPPGVFRERYTLADFEVTHNYGDGPNWSVSAARCKWSSEQVVLQTYTEVGNLSGCMAMALAAAHSLTTHPAFLPLYAVFRDVAAAAPGVAAGAAADSNGGAADRIVMVYPGGPAQHPLDAGCSPSSAGSPASSSGGGGGGSGPPVSERGVVRGMLQPLAELVTVLGSMGLRPPYVCGLDVWMDSPEAPGPGQALFMVPLMCHRRAHSAPEALLPAALPYAAPYLRADPTAAGDQAATDEGQSKRWLSWSAAALVHTVLIGSPPPEKAAGRKSRPRAGSEAPDATVPQLPPLNASSGGGAPARTGMLMPMGMGMQRQGGMLLQPSGAAGGGGGGASAVNGDGSGANGHGAKGAHGGGSNGTTTSSSRRSGGSTRGGADSMPLWLSDEAGDWFRRGLGLDCSSRPPFDEQMRHPWVSRHAVPRSVSAGNILKRESLGSLPRELHPLMLDMVPMGIVKPGREEVETLMADLAANEGPSAAKPAMPWQVVEGPQGAGPDVTVVVEEFTAPEYSELEPDRDTSVVERYEVAEEQKDDGTRIVEELRVVSGKPDGALTRAAKALQAAMARRVEPQTGQWVMANPRGSTFDDIARQNQVLRTQVGVPNVPGQRRASNGSPAPPPSIAARMRSPRAVPSTTAAPAPVATSGGTAAAAVANGASGATIGTSSVRGSTTSIASSGAATRNRSPGPRAAARVSPKPARPNR